MLKEVGQYYIFGAGGKFHISLIDDGELIETGFDTAEDAENYIEKELPHVMA